MRLSDAHRRILSLGVAVFRTPDAAACLGISGAHASKTLSRLAASGHLVRLARGLWAFADRVDRLALPEQLTDPFPSYISLQSALYYHGMISQIPAVTYAVSLARTRVYKTPLGAVSVHHIDPLFFFGFVPVGNLGAKMAVREKALVDFLYLGPAKTRLFSALPELTLPRRFNPALARRMAKRINSQRRRTLVTTRLEILLSRKD